MKLQDEYYEDENGHQIERGKIETFGSVAYKVDGFFEWDCGACDHNHSTRGFKIMGAAYRCAKCGKLNLLVRTDFKYLQQMVRNAERRDVDMDKRMRNAVYHMGQAVASLGER